MAFNPLILAWARAKAGFSVEEAAHALGFKDRSDRTAAERLQALETGAEHPPRNVLLKMARVYHRSLLLFYLREPPIEGDRGQDFRRAPGVSGTYNPTLDALIRDIRARQEVVRDLLEQAEPKRVDYVKSVTMSVPAADLARRITEKIGFSLNEFRHRADLPAAFNYLREKIEVSGAFVLLLGNLGSHHTNIAGGVFRGYAISDPVAPFIVINDQDARVAWAFTALHELTHIWLGATGVSGENVDLQLEAYCNSVAGEMLLPESEIRQLGALSQSSLQGSVNLIAQFANSRKISRAMVAYKLLRLNVISRAHWHDLERHYEEERLAAQARQSVEEKGEGGPSYYVVKRHRLGHALVDLVKNSLAEGVLTYTKAGQVLGVKPRNVDPLIYSVDNRGGL